MHIKLKAYRKEDERWKILLLLFCINISALFAQNLIPTNTDKSFIHLNLSSWINDSSTVQPVFLVDWTKNTANPASGITQPTNISRSVTSGCSTSIAIPDPSYSGTPTSLTWTMSGATTGSSPGSGINYIGTQTFNVGITSVTYTLVDDAGISSTASFIVTVRDNMPPSVSGMSNIVDNNISGCSQMLSIPDPTYSDNCYVPTVTWTMTGATTDASPATGINSIGSHSFNVGTTTVTYIVTDASNNMNSTTFTVTLAEPVPPTITCPAGFNYALATGSHASISVPDPTYSDNCSVRTLRWSMAGATTAQSSSSGINLVGTHDLNIGTTVITYTVTDDSGNSASGSFTVTVDDTEAPSVTCPYDVEASASSGCSTPVTLDDPVITDNGTISNVVWQMSGATTDNSSPSGINMVGTHSFNTGVTQVTYIAQDDAGNIGSCTFSVTVKETTPPTLTCPGDISQSISSGCLTSVAIPNPVYGDNCSFASLTWSMSGATTDSSPATGVNILNLHDFNVGTTTITYTATDAANNTTSGSFTVSVTESIPPTITCPGDVSDVLDATCARSLTLADPVYSDNCAVDALTWEMTGATTASSPTSGINLIGTYAFNAGITTVTYTVKDGSGNANSCSFTVSLSDPIAPTITCPADTTASTTTGTTATIMLSDPQYNDNCSVSSLTWEMTGATTGSSPTTGINTVGTQTLNLGTTTITYTVSDAAGNTASGSYAVTIKDMVAPTLSCPPDVTQSITLGCSAEITIAAPVYDDNDAVASVIWTMTGATSASSPTTGINILTTVTLNVGITTITYTVTDNAGNTKSGSFNVTLSELTPPEINCPANITQVISDCNTTLTLTDPTYSDNCSVKSLAWVMTGATTDSSPTTGINTVGTHAFNIGTTVITYTITDTSGNTQNCTTDITLSDTTPPVLICPLNISQEVVSDCIASITVPDPTYSDNCSVKSLTWVMTGATSDSSPSTGINTIGAHAFNVGTTVISYTATDGAGNSTTGGFIVMMKDIIPPVINLPLSINQILTNTPSQVINIPYPTYSDNCDVQTVTWKMTGATTGNSPSTGINLLGTQAFNSGTTTIEYTVTDVSGNVTVGSFTISLTPLANVIQFTKKSTKPKADLQGFLSWKYIIVLKNVHNYQITNIYLQDDLSKVFKNGEQYSVSSVSASGALKTNSLYDGLFNTSLLSASSIVRPLSQDSVMITVKVKPKYDTYKVYNQAVLNAASVAGNISEVPSNDPSNNESGAVEPKPTITEIPFIDLAIPTAITPNNDGYNDTFKIERTNNAKLTLEILNRWGVRVYQSFDYKNDWDGKGSGSLAGRDLPDGTYFYIITATTSAGDVSQYSGSITLHR